MLRESSMYANVIRFYSTTSITGRGPDSNHFLIDLISLRSSSFLSIIHASTGAAKSPFWVQGYPSLAAKLYYPRAADPTLLSMPHLIECVP